MGKDGQEEEKSGRFPGVFKFPNAQRNCEVFERPVLLRGSGEEKKNAQ